MPTSTYSNILFLLLNNALGRCVRYFHKQEVDFTIAQYQELRENLKYINRINASESHILFKKPSDVNTQLIKVSLKCFIKKVQL